MRKKKKKEKKGTQGINNEITLPLPWNNFDNQALNFKLQLIFGQIV